jgi:hypothetical protein
MDMVLRERPARFRANTPWFARLGAHLVVKWQVDDTA